MSKKISIKNYLLLVLNIGSTILFSKKDSDGKRLYEANLKNLKDWKMASKNEVVPFRKPNQYYLGTCYTPAFDFEKLGISDELTYISERYCSYQEANEFLKFLGVNDNFTSSNLPLLTSLTVASQFWQEIILGNLKFETFKKSFDRNIASIPAGDVCKKPSELYDPGIKEYIVDKSKLPSIDFSGLTVDNQSLNDWLGIKKTLSFADCLAYLRTEPKKQENLKSVVDMLSVYSSIPSQDSTVLQEFKLTGSFTNSSEEWMPVKHLVYFDSEDLRRVFGKHPNRIRFPSGPNEIVRKKICNWLGVQILSDSLFNVSVR